MDFPIYLHCLCNFVFNRILSILSRFKGRKFEFYLHLSFPDLWMLQSAGSTWMKRRDFVVCFSFHSSAVLVTLCMPY